MGRMLDDLAAYLAANTAWVAGSDLFAGDMPNEPDTLTVIHEPPSGPPLQVFGADGDPAVMIGRIQLVARAAAGVGAYNAARDRARQAYDLFQLVTNEDVNGVLHHRVEVAQEPFLIGRDESERPMIGFNADVWRVAE